MVFGFLWCNWFWVCSRYLVSATPTVLGRSFWNFTGVLIMVWRYACAFYRILLFFFRFFFRFFFSHFYAPPLKKWRGIMLYPLKFWVSIRLSVCPSVSAPTILLPATPPTLLGQSFSNSTGAFRMVWRYAYCFYRILNLFFITFFAFLTFRLFSSPNTTEMYREYVSSARNSTYSFRPIFFKLYRHFFDGLKICILFFQNPEIIFYYIFCIFNLDFFRALIQQKCIGSMYLVHATPPTFSGRSFWNFTHAFRMVWKYAYCFFCFFFQNPEIIFYHFLLHF